MTSESIYLVKYATVMDAAMPGIAMGWRHLRPHPIAPIPTGTLMLEAEVI